MRSRKLYALSLAAIIAAASMTFLTACGGKSTEETVASNEDPSSIKIDTKKLTDGGYYVRHQDGTLEPLYFGTATFDQGSTSTPSNDRVLWYRDDINKIPKLYAGDLLLFYSTKELSETFNFERFQDMKYTVGLCHMQLSPSGRYTISTNKDDNCTYPGSDADSILSDNNDNVVIDTIGGIDLRSTLNDNGEKTGTFLTRVGTLSGLTQNKSYAVQMYSGTQKLDTINLVADVDPFASYESFTSHDFDFLASDNVISIKLPEFMNSGWYLIDGEGVFKYVKGSKAEEAGIARWDEPLSDVPEDYDYHMIDDNGNGAGNDLDAAKVASSITSDFKVTAAGDFTIVVTLTVPENMRSITYDYPEASMQLTAPDGTTYPMTENDDGTYSYHFREGLAGNYSITYYNLENRIPNLSVS